MIDDTKGLFHKQNIIIKLLTVIVTVIVSLYINSTCFLILFAVLLLYLSADIKAIHKWFITMNFILPLFSSILLFTIIFDLALEEQVLRIIRVSFYLLLSVYLTGSVDQDQLFYYAKKAEAVQILYYILFFIIITFEISKELSVKFRKCRKDNQGIGSCFQVAAGSVYSDRDLLSISVKKKIMGSPTRLRSYRWPDLLVLPLLIIEFFIIVVTI
jgi:hypothetical protein